MTTKRNIDEWTYKEIPKNPVVWTPTDVYPATALKTIVKKNYAIKDFRLPVEGEYFISIAGQTVQKATRTYTIPYFIVDVPVRIVFTPVSTRLTKPKKGQYYLWNQRLIKATVENGYWCPTQCYIRTEEPILD